MKKFLIACVFASMFNIADATNHATNNGSPMTGDDSHMMLFGTIAMTSLLCMAVMVMFISGKKGKYQR